ncbi:MAG: MFS transporter, partial [Microbacteriaceae bacterium]
LDAMAYLTWPALIAPVIAPGLGGILTDFASWHWIFLINIPVGIAAFIVALRVVPATAERAVHRLDWSGFLLVGVSLAALVLGMDLVGAAPTDWLSVAVLLGVFVGAGALAVVRIRRARYPLLDFRALRIHTFRVGNVGGGMYRLLIGAAPFMFTLMFQSGFGWSATQAGVLVMAVFVGNVAIKPATSPLIRRFGFRAVIAGSSLGGALVFAACVFIEPSTSLVWIAIALAASGVFRSIGFSGYNSIQFADVPPALTSGANTLASTMQQIAVGLGVAVAALIVRVTTAAAAAVDPGQIDLGYRWSFIIVAVIMLYPMIEALRMPAHAGAEVAAR